MFLFRLLLVSLLQCISGTEADEQEGAAAERGIHVGVLTVDGETRSEEAPDLKLVVLVKGIPRGSVVVFLVTDLTVLEEAALCESTDAQAENDCDC